MTLTKTHLVCAALLAGIAAAPAISAAADDGPVTTLRTFLSDFNKGDVAGAAATNATSESIIDEIPPHAWNGPGAFQAWVADLTKDAAAKGQTDEQVSLDSIARDDIDGDRAYVVALVTFTYKQHGTPMVEHARMASTLANNGGAWKIISWAWAGEVPKAAS